MSCTPGEPAAEAEDLNSMADIRVELPSDARSAGIVEQSVPHSIAGDCEGANCGLL